MILVSNSRLLLTWLTPAEWRTMLVDTDRSELVEPYWYVDMTTNRDDIWVVVYLRVLGLEATIVL